MVAKVEDLFVHLKDLLNILSWWKKIFFVDTLKFPETKLPQLGLKISAGFSFSILNFQWRVSKVFVRIKEIVSNSPHEVWVWRQNSLCITICQQLMRISVMLLKQITKNFTCTNMWLKVSQYAASLAADYSISDFLILNCEHVMQRNIDESPN